MSPLNAIIVDDESLARRGLSLRLQQIPQVDVVAECTNGQEALAAIAEYSPDLVFLDIQMPGMGGFDVIRRLQPDEAPMIIFVTAFDQYAVDAFKVHAIDYVLKPIDDDRLHESIERAVAHHRRQASEQRKEKLVDLVMELTGASPGAIEQMTGGAAETSRWPEKITVKDGGEIRLIRVDDIRWIDAAGDYMCIHAGEQTYIMRTTMKQLEAMLDPERFLRIHRSTIVNSADISAAQPLNNGEYLLTLEGGTKLKVSRGYRERVRSLFNSA
jgi:two-component system LytT family response regulator